MSNEQDCVYSQIFEEDGQELIKLELPPTCLRHYGGVEGELILQLNKAMSEEVLMHLSLLRGGEDWSVEVSLSKEEFQQVTNLATEQDQTNEEFIRDLIAERLGKEGRKDNSLRSIFPVED